LANNVHHLWSECIPVVDPDFLYLLRDLAALLSDRKPPPGSRFNGILCAV
jgi:hypothetical protein